MPSSVGYLSGAFVAALALFFGLWWMLISGGDEAPWIPAGLAASVVLLVALSAREVVMRRAWTKYLLEQGGIPRCVPAANTSVLHRARVELRRSCLQRRGLFKNDRKKPMPGRVPSLILRCFNFARNIYRLRTTRSSQTIYRPTSGWLSRQDRIACERCKGIIC